MWFLPGIFASAKKKKKKKKKTQRERKALRENHSVGRQLPLTDSFDIGQIGYNTTEDRHDSISRHVPVNSQSVYQTYPIQRSPEPHLPIEKHNHRQPLGSVNMNIIPQQASGGYPSKQLSQFAPSQVF